jgi:hypothetical protein
MGWRAGALTAAAATLVAIGLAGPGSPTARADTSAPSFVPSGYTLGSPTFFDDFTSEGGTAADPAPLSSDPNWVPRTDVKQSSAQLAANDAIYDGELHLALQNQSAGGKSWTGAGVVSKKTFRYGFYEVRAQLPSAARWHSSFWAQCVTTTAGVAASTADSCRHTEIDGFENDSGVASGNTYTNIRHNIFDWSAGGSETSTGLYQMPFDPSAGMHTYGFDYTESGVSFYIDGALVSGKPSDANGVMAYTPPYHLEDAENIWFSVIGDTTAPAGEASAAVDWIGYWQKDYYAGPAISNQTLNGVTSADLANTCTSGNAGDESEADDTTYSFGGSGWSCSSLPGFARSSSRYTFSAGASVTATVTPSVSGTYSVSAWIPESTTNSADQRYTVTGLSSPVDLENLQSLTASGWQTLGTVSVTAGQTQTVTFDSPGGGILRADAIRYQLQ